MWVGSIAGRWRDNENGQEFGSHGRDAGGRVVTEDRAYADLRPGRVWWIDEEEPYIVTRHILNEANGMTNVAILNQVRLASRPRRRVLNRQHDRR